MMKTRRHGGGTASWPTLVGWYWFPVIGYATAIFYFSSLPFPSESVPDFLEEAGDKVLHMLEYGLLGILSYQAFRHGAGPWGAKYALLLAIGFSAFYGLTDEVHQAFVPERDADVYDVLADALGACLVTWCWHMLVQARDRKKLQLS